MSVSDKGRLQSVDALRGFDMFWILGGEKLFAALFVLSGWHFWQIADNQMAHSSWHGFTFYDFIFPLFIFLSGVSLGLANKQLSALTLTQRAPVYKKALKRLLLLSLLGVIYNHGWGTGLPSQLEDIRFASVLGRIAIAWFLAAMIVWHFRLVIQIAIALSILLLNFILHMLVESPSGQLGIENSALTWNAWFDERLLLGASYQNLAVDPEGVMSHFPAVVNALIGVWFGQLIRLYDNKPPSEIVWHGTIIGLVLLALGGSWDLVYPVNKTLWTSSFVFVSAGWSVILMSVFYWLFDVIKLQKIGMFFIVIGLNSIAIYLSTSLINWQFTAQSLFGGLISASPDAVIPLLQVIALILVQWLVLFYMYRKRLFVHV